MAKKKTKTNNKKKVGKYGEVVISKFGGAINALKHKYRADFPDMVMYLHFNALGKNFIFQRIQSFPLEKISYCSESYSVEFQAKWQGGGALGYMLHKPLFEIESQERAQTVGWGGVASFRPKVRYEEKQIERNGRWVDIEEADDIIAENNISIDSIRSVNMYEWGFELIGDVISLLAVNSNLKFSKFPKNISMDVANLSFDFGKKVGDDELIVRWSQPGYEPIKNKVPDFNRELFCLDNDEVEEEKPDIVVKNIGQRCLNNLDI